MIANIRKGICGLVLTALLAAGFVLAYPSGYVSAAVEVQEPQPQTEGTRSPDPARLERAYQRQLELMEGQADRLSGMEERSVDFAERIAEFKENGKDVSILEEALASYDSALAEARGLHEEASQILAAHAGFDTDGKVTDVEQAAETLKEAGIVMREFHRELRSLPREIMKALREFRRNNRNP